MECTPLQIGGYTDHVHLLCMLSKNIALVQLIRELKANSSCWIKKQGPALSGFFWQTGYGAFSVSHFKVPDIINYIQKQHEHHLQESYQDEMRYQLRINGMELDEKYFWE
jgi:REP element-mobilizing transposase RayT